MFEKMLTTCMSRDKKKLQNRFLKIRTQKSRIYAVLSGFLFFALILILISVSVLIALKNVNDFNMTEEEFSEYVNRPLGAVIAELDYIDDEIIVFHYLEGFFVKNKNTNDIIHKINLGKLNIAGHHQGDVFTEVLVDAKGDNAYLINRGNIEKISKYDNYIINLNNGRVKKGELSSKTKLFSNYQNTITAIDNPYGWHSIRCIPAENKGIYYITVSDGMTLSLKLAYLDYENYNNTHYEYLFNESYTNYSERIENAVENSLESDEELIGNSGYYLEIKGENLKDIYNKLSETRNLKFPEKLNENYCVSLHHIWKSNKSNPVISLTDSISNELIWSFDLTSDELLYFLDIIKAHN